MSYWYCPKCKRDLASYNVTYQELCAFCGTSVLSVDKEISSERANEIYEAEIEGRLIILPEPEESDYEGLKIKYRVYKARNNEPVENCFVLRPDKDPAAMEALIKYSHVTPNKALANDLIDWIGIMRGKTPKKEGD